MSESTAFNDRLASVLLALPEAANAHSVLRRIGRSCSVDFVIEVDDTPFHISVREGLVRSVVRGPFAMKSWTFAIRASGSSWKEFFRTIPRPGYNDIFAMSAYGHARIDGDVGPLLSDLRYLKELLALCRGEFN